jgi:hypothetical protein
VVSNIQSVDIPSLIPRMEGYNIRAPRSSMTQDSVPFIPVDDGSGDVWVSFGVYHHLHCLVNSP